MQDAGIKIMQKLPNSLTSLLLFFLRPYRIYFYTLLATGLLWAIQLSLGPYLLKSIIDTVASDSTSFSDKQPIIMSLVVFYIILWITEMANFRFVDWLKLKFYPNLRRDIIDRLSSYVQNHSYQFFQNNFVGNVTNKIFDLSSGFSSVLDNIDEAFSVLCSLIIASIMMYFVSPIFSLIFISWAVMFLGVTLYYTKFAHHKSLTFSESRSKLFGVVIDSISNIISIKLFTKHRQEQQKISVTIDEVVDKDRKLQRYLLHMRIVQDATYVFLIGGEMIALVYFYRLGEITAGDFILILNISIAVSQFMWRLASQFVQFAEDFGKCSQSLSLINKAHRIEDDAKAKDIDVKKGEIEFKNVTFHYGKNGGLYDDLNIKIKAGEKVGLVGYSGSGKTTFLNLLVRFFDVEKGCINIDQQDIASTTQSSLRKNISVIPQDTTLFHRSLWENIKFGNDQATDQEVLDASKQAYCHEFIEDLPEKYNTFVGERGVKLSGGQRQRIAIARAFLNKAPILILDEATSALDSLTEERIQDSLYKLMNKSTTIVIAHRLSTLSQMDRILVFDKGQIVEDGTHEQLLEKTGHYKKMWSMQAGGFLPQKDISKENT